MKTPLIETMLGWLSAGFVIMWILEYRRTDFQQSYWLLMVSLACLFSFQLLRTRRLAHTNDTPKTPTPKKTPKNKKK